MSKDYDGDVKRDEGLLVSQDRLTDGSLSVLAHTQTAVDGQGTERIVTTATRDWEPAPMEATDEQKAHLEKINERFDEASRTRQTVDAKPTEIKDEDRQPNDQGQGGSQVDTGSSNPGEGSGDKVEEVDKTDAGGQKLPTTPTHQGTVGATGTATAKAGNK